MEPLRVLLAAEGHKPPPLVDLDGTVLIQLGFFLFLWIVLSRLVFKPYLALRGEQHANIEGARQTAEREQAEAADKLAHYEQQVLRARKEAAAGRVSQRAHGEEAAQQILAEARTQAEAKVQEARKKIQQTAPAAQLTLRARADQLAQMVVAKVLGRTV